MYMADIKEVELSIKAKKGRFVLFFVKTGGNLGYAGLRGRRLFFSLHVALEIVAISTGRRKGVVFRAFLKNSTSATSQRLNRF
jgi:hypothetical protein